MIENIDPMENLYNIIGEARERAAAKGKAGRKSTRPDKATLEKLYVEEKLTLKQISERLKTSESAVHKWMTQYEIPKRPRGGNVKKEAVGMPMVVEKIASVKGTNDNIYAVTESEDVCVAQNSENIPDTECPAENNVYPIAIPILDSVSLECGNVYCTIYRDKIEIDTVEYSFEDARSLRDLLNRALGININKIIID